MRSVFSAFLAGLVSLGFVALAPAQPVRPPAQVSARLHCLSVTGSTITGLVVVIDKADVALSAPSDFLSPVLDYRGPAMLAIYPAKPANEVPSAAPAPRLPLATVELPPTGGEFVLLFGQSGGVLKVMKVDFSPAAVPQGGYAFWNISTRRLGVSLEPAKALIAPGQMQVVTPGSPDRSYLALRVFDEHDGEARQLFAARHLHRATQRQLVFMSDVPDSDRVRLKIITQRVFPPPPKPVAVAAR